MVKAEHAYWLARRHELMDMIRDLNSPHLFFTLSNVRWVDRHKPLYFKEQFHRWDSDLHSTPHSTIARVQLFIKDYLTPLLGVVHFWYRFEWRGRHTAHVHGFLWLKDAPKGDEINWELLKEKNATIPEDQEKKMQRFVDYWDPIITTFDPLRHRDENMPHIGDHPSCKSREAQRKELIF